MSPAVIEYTPRHFRVSELVDKQTYAMYGDGALSLFDPRILKAADMIRDFFGVPVTCNDWMSGGHNQYRGFRPEDCAVGAPRSEHKRGRALDLSIRTVDATDARLTIIRNTDIFVPYIKRMESGVSWLHIDCSPYSDQSKITLFKAPK